MPRVSGVNVTSGADFSSFQRCQLWWWGMARVDVPVSVEVNARQGGILLHPLARGDTWQ